MSKNIKLSKPYGGFSGQGPVSAGDEVFPHYCLEMDVDDSYPLYCFADDKGQLQYDPNYQFSVNSQYAEIVSKPGCAVALVAKKSTVGANEIRAYPDYIVLTGTKVRNGETETAAILVRIYDKPTGVKIIRNTKEIGSGMPDVPVEGKLLLEDGLEVKPGESFKVICQVTPKTAQQAVSFFSNSKSMQSNIDKMTVKNVPSKGICETTFTLSKDACYFAGNPFINESTNFGTYMKNRYGTFLGTKRGHCKTEIQLQVVEYKSEEPKPLDYLTCSMPGGFKYPIGGRFGTIDGGLRITKDVDGRSLIKDVYKKLIPDPTRCPAVAVILEMTKKDALNHQGISFSYHWDAVTGSPVKYEVETNPKYKNAHGYAVAVHTCGKKVCFNECPPNYVIETGTGWVKANKQFGNIRADNDDGFRLTAHYQYYNHLAPAKERIYPITLLQDYHNRYPTIKYVTHYDKEDFTCTHWFIPSASEFLKLNLNHLNSLENSLFNPLRNELGFRMKYLRGFNDQFYWFWTSCISKDKENAGHLDYSQAVSGVWTIHEKAYTEDTKKSLVRDVLPFFRF
jgi:hypothetical protein